MLNFSGLASRIVLTPEGLWVSPTISAVSYPEDDNDFCFAVEDNSFWFSHRNRCILNSVRLFPPSGTFFDVGGGNGYVAKELQDSGQEVVLVEPGRGARNARRRGVVHVVHSTLQDAGFHTGVCPAVGLFDVVEHIQNDRVFLSDIHAYLIPGGRVYITVPAFQRLWSHEDIDAGHYRRYTLSQMCRLLGDVGFQVDYASYFFDFLLLPIYFLRALPFSLGISSRKSTPERMREDHHISNPLAKGLIDWLCRRELNRLALGRSSSVGASCLVVASKQPA